MNAVKQFFLRTVLCSTLLSCEEHRIAFKVPGDHFPLEDGGQISYKQETFSADKSTLWSSDTITLTVQGDTLIEERMYKKIVNNVGLLEKVVRKEGTQYYGRNHEAYGGFSREYLFLDTSLPVNSSWAHIKDEHLSKTEYVVVATGSTQVIRDIEYKDVIELDVNYYVKNEDGVTWRFLWTAKHFYAAGIGEIYSYYPSLSLIKELSILSPQKN